MKSTPPVSALTSHIGYWLRFVSNHVSQTFARKVEARGATVAEWVVMRELFEARSLAPSHLATAMGMTKGGITKLADRLVDKGLVIRTADPKDGRAQTLSLTAKGRKLVPELAALADKNDAEFFACIAPNDRAALSRILRQIVERRTLKSVPIE